MKLPLYSPLMASYHLALNEGVGSVPGELNNIQQVLQKSFSSLCIKGEMLGALNPNGVCR